ncbi:hypothetical protein M3Y99_00706800 [Aphelenchoides fujianensis]|nr:hypothetical protein M3Y99_00706800 [Aphelenchoides fujianensis]
MTYVATATSTSFATAVSVNRQHRRWLEALNRLDLRSGFGPAVWTDPFGYEHWLLGLLRRVERTAGWEACGTTAGTAAVRTLQRHVVQPLKVGGRVAFRPAWPGVLLRAAADCEPVLRALATEFNGNAARVDVRDLLNRRFRLHASPARGLLRLLKHKLRPFVLVLDHADLLLSREPDPLVDAERVRRLKRKLCACWPTADDLVVLLLPTRLPDAELDRKFVADRLRTVEWAEDVVSVEDAGSDADEEPASRRLLLPTSRTITEV